MQDLSDLFQVHPFNTKSYQQIIQKPSVQGSVKSILHSNSEDSQSLDTNSLIVSTFLINNCEQVIEYPLETKYNDFIMEIEQKFFPRVNASNPLILTHGWDPIIPQSNNSTIGQTILNMTCVLNVYTLNYFLSELAVFLNKLQDSIQSQQKQLSWMEGQIKTNQEELKKISESENQLQQNYNQLKKEYIITEYNYEMYLLKIKQNNLLQDNNKTIQEMNDFTFQLMADKNEVQFQSQKLTELLHQQQQQNQQAISQIQQLQNQRLLLKEELSKFNQQQEQFVDQQENKQIKQNQKTFKQFPMQEQKINYLTQQQQQNQQEIEAQKQEIQQPRLMKQNKFIQNIQKYFFLKLNKQNQQIFETEWNPIIPNSITVILAQQDDKFYFKNQSLYSIQFYLTNHLDRLQDTNKAQNQQMLEQQQIIKIISSKIKMEITKYKELEVEYNILRQNNELLESNYKQSLEIVEQHIFIKNTTSVVKMMTKYIIKLKNDIQIVEQQNQKLADLCRLEKLQIESSAQKIQTLQNETLCMNDKLQQFLKQEEQVKIQQQSSILISEFELEQSQSQYYQQQQVFEKSEQQEQQEVQDHYNSTSRLQHNMDYYQQQQQQIHQQVQQEQNQSIESLPQLIKHQQQKYKQSDNDQDNTLTLKQCKITSIDMQKLDQIQQNQFELRQSTRTQHSQLRKQEAQISREQQILQQNKCQNCNYFYNSNNFESQICSNCPK